MRIPPDLIKGDGLLAVKRYMNKTAHMVIFKVLVTDAALGKRGEYIYQVRIHSFLRSPPPHRQRRPTD